MSFQKGWNHTISANESMKKKTFGGGHRIFFFLKYLCNLKLFFLFIIQHISNGNYVLYFALKIDAYLSHFFHRKKKQRKEIPKNKQTKREKPVNIFNYSQCCPDSHDFYKLKHLFLVAF